MKSILIKTFSDINIANSFLHEGTILFREIKYYSTIEDNSRFDDAEGKLVGVTNIEPPSKNTATNVNTHGGAKITALLNHADNIGNYRIIVQGEVKGTIYCFTIIEIDQEYEDIINEIEKFGDYAVVIFDLNSFWEIVCKSIEKINLEDGNQIEGIEGIPVLYKSGESGAFVKDIKYMKESEFRLAIGLHGNFPNQYSFTMGSISKCASLVTKNDLRDYLIKISAEID